MYRYTKKLYFKISNIQGKIGYKDELGNLLMGEHPCQLDVPLKSQLSNWSGLGYLCMGNEFKGDIIAYCESL